MSIPVLPRSARPTRVAAAAVAALALALAAAAGPVQAVGLYLSHAEATPFDFGGLTGVTSSEVVHYDTQTGVATRVFDAEAFLGVARDVDAVSFLPNGNLAFSFAGSALLLEGITVDGGDVLEVDLSGVSPSFVGRLFDEDALFDLNEDLDALARFDNGDFLISTAGPSSVGGTPFDDGDLIRFSPGDPLGTFALFFDEDGFFDGDLDALALLADDRIAFSTVLSEAIGPDEWFPGDAVVLELTGTNTGTFEGFLFDGSAVFTGNPAARLGALHVPEPHPAWLAAAAALAASGWACASRQRRAAPARSASTSR